MRVFQIFQGIPGITKVLSIILYVYTEQIPDRYWINTGTGQKHDVDSEFGVLTGDLI